MDRILGPVSGKTLHKIVFFTIPAADNLCYSIVNILLTPAPGSAHSPNRLAG
jgi:hypothetical protein